FLYFNIICKNKIVGLQIAINSIDVGYTELLECVSIYYMHNYNGELFIKYNTMGYKNNIVSCIYRLYAYYLNNGDMKNAVLMYRAGHKLDTLYMIDHNALNIRQNALHTKQTNSLLSIAKRQNSLIDEQKKLINVLNDKLKTTLHKIPVSINAQYDKLIDLPDGKNVNTFNLSQDEILHTNDSSNDLSNDLSNDVSNDLSNDVPSELVQAVAIYIAINVPDDDVSYDESDDILDEDYILNE
ncbi:unnamed protein product, partial [marine sediment metagenome]